MIFGRWKRQRDAHMLGVYRSELVRMRYFERPGPARRHKRILLRTMLRGKPVLVAKP